MLRSKMWLGWLVAGGIGLGLTSCDRSGPQEEAQVEAVATKTFGAWCSEQKFTNCQVKPQLTDAASWKTSLELLPQVVNSPSKLDLRRADLQLASVRSLIKTLGAESLIGFLSQIPWETLQLNGGTLLLSNSKPNGTLNFNGLQVTAAQKVSVKMLANSALQIDGLAMGLAAGKIEKVGQIIFGAPGTLSLVGQTMRVDGIPLEFFNVAAFKLKDSFVFADVFNAVAGIAFDSSFPWQQKVQVSLGKQQLDGVRATLKVGQQAATGDFMAVVLQFLGGVRIGGVGNVASATVGTNSKDSLDCTLSISNVPILGSADVHTSIANSIGIKNVTRKGLRVSASVFGISTDVGNVETIEAEGNKLWVKVGLFTVPLQLDGDASTNGTANKLRCEIRH